MHLEDASFKSMISIPIATRVSMVTMTFPMTASTSRANFVASGIPTFQHAAARVAAPSVGAPEAGWGAAMGAWESHLEGL